MKYQLVDAQQYVTEATEAINTATSRVSVIAMVIADHGDMHPMIEALKAAARRGVKVTVAADVFTYGEVSGSFLPIRYYSKGARQATKMAKSMRKAGVSFHWLGNGRLTVFNGRTHSKWCIVDDLCFVFGGVNLYDEGLKHIDYMLKTTDMLLADRLHEEQRRIQKAEKASRNYGSVTYELSGERVLFDGGIIGNSVIYRRACELTKEAESVVFVSQYCPTSKLALLLKKTPHTLYFNRPELAGYLNRTLIRLSMFLSRLQTSYTGNTYIHAKCMIFTMPDGHKIAITGSHNFAYTGVMFGTREVALETKDPAVINALESFIDEHIVRA